MQSTDLNLLVALDALLAEGSVVGAAARLGLTPSAMSRTLARIRAQTGDPILVRAGRGLVPTPRALAMQARVRATVEEAEALLGPPAPVDPRRFDRVLHVRVDDSVVAVLGPALLDALRRESPGLTVVFRAEGAEDLASLRDGSIDLDIGVQGPLGPEVRTRKIADDERVVLVRGSAPAPRRRMSLRAYAEAEHVDVSRRGLRRGPIDDVLEQQGLSRRVRAVVPDQLAAAVLVARSDALALVSRHLALSLRGVLDVRFVPAPAPLEKVSIALAWHPRHDGDPAHAWLRGRLHEIAQTVRKAHARSG